MRDLCRHAILCISAAQANRCNTGVTCVTFSVPHARARDPQGGVCGTGRGGEKSNTRHRGIVTPLCKKVNSV